MEDSVLRSRVAMLWQRSQDYADLVARLRRMEMRVDAMDAILDDVVHCMADIGATQRHANEVLTKVERRMTHGTQS